MLWHIVRKDWKLLRHAILLVAICNALVRILAFAFGPFDDIRGRALTTALSMIDPAAIIATAALIVLIAQTDPIPGLAQDWLVRPIRRRDLLLAKIVSVALFAQAPIFLFEVAECLANGFPFWPSIAAPLARSLYMFLAFDLPVLALAALTRGHTGYRVRRSTAVPVRVDSRNGIQALQGPVGTITARLLAHAHAAGLRNHPARRQHGSVDSRFRPMRDAIQLSGQLSRPRLPRSRAIAAGDPFPRKAGWAADLGPRGNRTLELRALARARLRRFHHPHPLRMGRSRRWRASPDPPVHRRRALQPHAGYSQLAPRGLAARVTARLGKVGE